MGNHTEDHGQVHPAPKVDLRPDNGVPALEAWAETIETSFNEIQQSLTNPQTRAAFLRTLDMWERILQGSHAGGVISDEQLRELMIPLDGMRQAPSLIDTV